MALLDDVTRDLLEKYGWVVSNINTNAKTADVTKNGNIETLPFWVIQDIVSDEIKAGRVRRKLETVEAAVLTLVQDFESQTGLPVSNISLTKVDEGTTAVSVQVNYTL